MMYLLLVLALLFATGLLYTGGEDSEASPDDRGIAFGAAVFVLGIIGLYYLSNMSWIRAMITLTVLVVAGYCAWVYLGRSFPELVRKISPSALLMRGMALLPGSDRKE